MKSKDNPKPPEELARQVFERDNYTCQGCHLKLPCVLDLTPEQRGDTVNQFKVLYLIVDHVDGPSLDIGNLQALCWRCNAKKSGRGNNSFKLYMAIQRLGRPMTYYPAMAALVGLKESIFLCQLIYWTPRGRHERGEGWIYKSVEEMTEETGLSYKEQARLRVYLVKEGLIEEKYDRAEHRLYFRVNVETLDALGEHVTNGQMPKSQVASDQKEDGTLPKVSSYKEAEITTEITTKITKPSTSQSSVGELSLKEKEPDPRHHIFRKRYEELYVKYNRCPAGEVPFGPKEAGMLGRILRDHKGWSEKFLIACLENYFKSDTNPAEPISVWIHRLPAWRNGPVMRGRTGVPVVDTPRENPLTALRAQRGRAREPTNAVAGRPG